MKIRIDELSEAVQAELEQYAGEVQENVDAAVIRVARRCLKKIRKDSPKRSGAYRKGWRMQIEKGPLSTAAVIYNRTRWFLIHLLEDGHQKAAGGRVEGTPHVEPAGQQAEKELVDELTNVLRER